MMKKNTNLKIKINRHKISMLRFGDDIALISESQKDQVQLIKTTDETFKNQLEMRINGRKQK